jgi:hypothetical protein
VRIYIAGGVHEDPLCRERLVVWLRELVDHLGHPTFVAVEMDPNIRWYLRGRRGMFDCLAGGIWGDGVDPNVARMLAGTMAWEVDAHSAVIDINPIFLDEAGTREGTVDAKLHFTLMMTRLKGFEGDRRNTGEVTAYISARASTAADQGAVNRYKDDPDYREKEAIREERWLRPIRQELRMEGWGLVVVGAMHASRYDDRTFRSLLAATPGVEIGDVRYLTWSPPADIA